MEEIGGREERVCPDALRRFDFSGAGRGEVSPCLLGDLNPRTPRFRRPGDELRTLEQVIGIVITKTFRHHTSLQVINSRKQAA